jgi:hypothetical protein
MKVIIHLTEYLDFYHYCLYILTELGEIRYGYPSSEAKKL